MWLKPACLIAALPLLFAPTHARAFLDQLADAYADVVTFGAWGNARDNYRAQMELLKLQYEEQLQRARNVTSAQISTTRIQERQGQLLDVRQLGQDLLKLRSAVDVLIAQQKDLVVERFNQDKNVKRFEEWFNAFVSGDDMQFAALVALIAQSSRSPEGGVKDTLEALKLARAQRDADLNEARSYLRNAMATAKASRMKDAMSQILSIRAELTRLIEDRRAKLRELAGTMLAEDRARRKLCDPDDTVGVTCNAQGCAYYSPDRARPLPCDSLVYLNYFPVQPFVDALATPESYRENYEFFLFYEKLGSSKAVTQHAYSSTSQIFGAELSPSALMPAEFLAPKGCSGVATYANRLRQGLEYAAIFSDAEDRSSATRSNIQRLRDLQPMVEFWLDTLLIAVPKADGCHKLSGLPKRRIAILLGAVGSLESFGSSLTNNEAFVTDHEKSIEAVKILANDF